MRRAVLAVACLGVVGILLCGCGSDDDGGLSYVQGTVTVTVDGVTVDMSQMTSAQYEPVSGMMGVSGYSGSQIISITFTGSSPGTWTSPGAGGTIAYGDASGNYFTSSGGGSYAITVTSCGAVGERIEGTFSGTVTGSAGSRTVSGTFSVIRIAEQG